MTVSLIAAFSKNNVIGNIGRIPWNIPEDRLHFKTLTLNHAVIFGRKTFEEIGKPLPDRINIVVSTTKAFEDKNLYTVSSLEKAIKLAEKLAEGSTQTAAVASKAAFNCNSCKDAGQTVPNLKSAPNNEIFVCGGQQLYREAIFFAEKLYITKINQEIEGDTFFPEVNKNQFQLVSKSKEKHQNGYSFQFLEYKRI